MFLSVTQTLCVPAVGAAVFQGGLLRSLSVTQTLCVPAVGAAVFQGGLLCSSQ